MTPSFFMSHFLNVNDFVCVCMCACPSNEKGAESVRVIRELAHVHDIANDGNIIMFSAR